MGESLLTRVQRDWLFVEVVCLSCLGKALNLSDARDRSLAQPYFNSRVSFMRLFFFLILWFVLSTSTEDWSNRKCETSRRLLSNLKHFGKSKM